MKTKSVELNKIWPKLYDILSKYNGMTPRVVAQLRQLGISVISNGNHKKLILPDSYIIVVSGSPSDNYAGRQILRDIRRHYERKEF